VVDDYEPMRFLKAHVLSKAGFEVAEAATGREALRIVTRDKPHLVLLDLNLPDIYGVDVCREIKSRETTSLPVIYTTADSGTDELPQTGDGCIVGVKPQEMGKLHQITALSAHRQGRTPARALAGFPTRPQARRAFLRTNAFRPI